MTSAIDVARVREALADLPEGTSYGALPRPKLVYLPMSHLKAMDPNCLLVTGMRGAGKTFWWSALQHGTVRQMLAHHMARGTFSDKTEVRIGFGVRREPSEYPNKEVLHELMGRGVEPRIIWRTVVAWQVAPDSHCLRHHNSWSTRVEYVRSNPEPINHLFEARDKELHDEGIFCLILFDALDRCADDWEGMYSAVRGLMQTAVDMRAYRRLRLKLFLQSDQINLARTADFPNAYKVLSSTVELSWPRHELYGLLWHSLANGRNGDVLRIFWETATGRRRESAGCACMRCRVDCSSTRPFSETSFMTCRDHGWAANRDAAFRIRGSPIAFRIPRVESAPECFWMHCDGQPRKPRTGTHDTERRCTTIASSAESTRHRRYVSTSCKRTTHGCIGCSIRSGVWSFPASSAKSPSVGGAKA